jgi:hypothetical protein
VCNSVSNLQIDIVIDVLCVNVNVVARSISGRECVHFAKLATVQETYAFLVDLVYHILNFLKTEKGVLFNFCL